MDASVVDHRGVLRRVRLIAALPHMSDRRLLAKVRVLDPGVRQGSYQEALVVEAARRGLVKAVAGGC